MKAERLDEGTDEGVVDGGGQLLADAFPVLNMTSCYVPILCIEFSIPSSHAEYVDFAHGGILGVLIDVSLRDELFRILRSWECLTAFCSHYVHSMSVP